MDLSSSPISSVLVTGLGLDSTAGFIVFASSSIRFVFSVSVFNFRLFVTIYLFLRFCLLIISFSFKIFSESDLPSIPFIYC